MKILSLSSWDGIVAGQVAKHVSFRYGRGLLKRDSNDQANIENVMTRVVVNCNRSPVGGRGDEIGVSDVMGLPVSRLDAEGLEWLPVHRTSDFVDRRHSLL
jgi:hypothetical protein